MIGGPSSTWLSQKMEDEPKLQMDKTGQKSCFCTTWKLLSDITVAEMMKEERSGSNTRAVKHEQDCKRADGHVCRTCGHWHAWSSFTLTDCSEPQQQSPGFKARRLQTNAPLIPPIHPQRSSAPECTGRTWRRWDDCSWRAPTTVNTLGTHELNMYLVEVSSHQVF